MPTNLRRGLTAILRGKKAGSTVSVAIEPISPTSEQQPDRFVSILENEEIEDEQQLQRALIESLHAALEEEKEAAVQRLREKDRQIRQMQQTATQLSIQSDQLIEAAMSSHALREENEDLKAQLKEYQVSLARMVETQAQTQKELETLRAQTRNPANVDHQRSSAQHPPDSSWAKMIEEDRASPREHIKLLGKNVESAMAFAESLKQQLEHERLSHQEEIKRIKTSNPLNVSTARELIAFKSFSDRLAATLRVEPVANERLVKEATSITDLTSHMLGAKLSEEQVTLFLREAEHPSFDITAQICTSCTLPRIYSRRYPRLTEFSWTGPVPHTNLCVSWVCKDCYLDGILKSLHDDYWTVDIRKSCWLRCPASDCPDPLLGIHDRTAFQRLLETYGDRNVVYHLSVYDNIKRLRQRLAEMWCDPPPSNDQLLLTSELHNQLIQKRIMFSFQDPEETRVTESLFSKPDDLRMIEIEHSGRSVRIPLFTALFRRQATPKECVFCTEEVFEIDFGSLQNWLDAACGFEGDWMWEVMNFPVKLAQTCEHPVDFCTGCFGRHVRAKLEDDGRAGCDKIACPHPDCGRLLTYDEIRLYAQESTFATYDQYLNLNALSQFPNFRWCLGPECKNGQLYDLEDDRDLPRGGPLIQCEECEFAMCYTHSVPWHKGQTCKQYASEHTDPNSQLSRDWIDENTKNCPRCSVPINKGDQCFHMTCNCGHEFCWLCLANWNLIRPDAGTYNQEAHEEGCFFRTSELRPTQLTGTSLNEALELRRNRS